MIASVLLGLVAAPALGGPLEDARDVELDRVRAQVADQIQLAAYDLIDELVWRWTQEPVFDEPTPVVLAGVTVPVGLGSGMQALVENHVADVVGKNPTSRVQLVHCPTCTAVVVHSGPEGTVVSRGIDNPTALAELGDTSGKHALFVDLEAEGTFLVLRARLTRLTPDLPIVWSHTIATSSSSPALLRSGDDLKSASDARQEYLDALRGRGPLTVPVRMVLRTYARSFQNVPPPPFLWVQTGVELATDDNRAWTGSVLVGYSFIPQAYQGIMGQARVSRLITGRARSPSRPDVYGFVGTAAITVWGPATSSFQIDPINADDIAAALNGDGPRTSFGALQVGLDVRVGNRVGLSAFLENIPSLGDSQNIGTYFRVATIGFQSLGTEVTFCF